MRLTDAQETYRLKPHLEVFADESGEISFEQISGGKFEDQFVPAEEIDLSNLSAVYWMQVEIENQAPEFVDWLVVFDQYRVNQISAYLPEKDSGGYRAVHTGNTFPYSSRDIDYRLYVFKLGLEIGESSVVYFRLSDMGGVSIEPFEIQSLEQFTQNALREQFWTGAYYFVILTILVYNVFFIFSLRDKATFSFVLFLLAVIFTSLSADGIGHQVIWQNWVQLAEFSTIISILMFVAALINYSIVELETRLYFPGLYRASRAVVLGFVLLILVRIFTRIPQEIFTPIFAVFLISGFLLPIILALRTLKVKRRRSLIFLSAFVVYLAAVIFMAVIALIDSPAPDSLNLTRFAFVWLLFVFTSTANTRIGSLRREREQSQESLLLEKQEALHLQTELTAEISLAREELEARVQERTIELRESNQELESFSYSVSHDLRAPLRSIKGFTDIILEEYGKDLPEGIGDYFSRIVQSVAHMDELIKDLLALSKLSREKLQTSQVNLSAIADHILTAMKNSNPEIETELSISPDIQFECDPHLIRIALQNIFENSWKFSVPTGKVEITFGIKEADGNQVYFIRDQGIGFKLDDPEKVFDVFQRFHTDIPGTGIGLAIVQRIFEKHGGEVWAESEAGKGTTIYFSNGATPAS
ncbi:MAG: sensor histidine kinase [Chloroflexota bacterium]